ncbi:MAG: FAD:protein FMN transferase [bacterium]
MKQSTRILIVLAIILSIPALASTAVPTAKKEKAAEAAIESSPSLHQYTTQGTLGGGQPISITVVAPSSDEGSARAALSAALGRAMAFEREFFAEGGVESQLNALKRGQPLTLSADGFEFISRSVKLATLTGGWFDITAPSQKNWFQKKDWRRISLDETAKTVTFKSDGMAVDFHRIAPGFATDIAMDELAKQGFTNAMAEVGPVHRNSGRDIFTPWNIQIGFGENSTDGNAYRAYRYNISNVAAATVTPSGLGKGLVDPLNKKPVSDNAMRSITILAADATTATAYALAAYTVGPKFGLQYVEAHPETRGIMVDVSGNLLASRGLNIVTAPERDDNKQATADGGSNDLRQKQREESQEQ